MGKNKTIKTDIFISGGGVPGFLLASLLAQSGFDVTIADPAPCNPYDPATPDGRTAALMERSIEAFINVGAWAHCKDHGADLQTLRIIDDSQKSAKSPTQIDFKASEIARARFGRNVPISAMRAALYDVAQKHANIHILSEGLYDFTTEDNSVRARTDSGTEITARLIIGADGRHSPTRKIAGIECKTHDYGRAAITCLLSHTQDHEYISTEFHRPSGPFTLVPMPGQTSALVWVDTTDNIEAFMRLPRGAFIDMIQTNSRDILGSVDLISDPLSWPLKMLKAKRLTAPRTILIAEAAHVLTPLGAQGLNLSIRDATILAAHLTEAARSGQDIGTKIVLDGYEAKRRHDMSLRVMGTHSLMQMVTQDSAAVSSLRKMGLKTLDKLPAIKKMLMNEGLAPQSL